VRAKGFEAFVVTILLVREVFWSFFNTFVVTILLVEEVFWSFCNDWLFLQQMHLCTYLQAKINKDLNGTKNVVLATNVFMHLFIS